MAARVDADDVKLIIDTDLTDARIDAFINGAHAVVEKTLADESLGESLLKEIERWLSAHYIAAVIERQAIHEKAGPAEQRFADVFGKLLESTTYGQTAMGLDTSGLLASSGRRAVVLLSIDEEDDD